MTNERSKEECSFLPHILLLMFSLCLLMASALNQPTSCESDFPCYDINRMCINGTETLGCDAGCCCGPTINTTSCVSFPETQVQRVQHLQTAAILLFVLSIGALFAPILIDPDRARRAGGVGGGDFHTLEGV